jgi:hypothetical protein
MIETNAEKEQWTRIHPALDFTAEHAYFGQKLRYQKEAKYYIITDQGFVICTQPEENLEYIHLALTQQPYACSETRWSTASIDRFSKLKRYPTQETIALDKPKLLEALKNQFIQYIEFSDERYHTFFALWNIGTYCHPLFNSYPYVHLVGLAQSGKSKLLSLCSCLSFNGMHTPDTSTACIFRLIEKQRISLFLDEAENFANKNEFAERTQIEPTFDTTSAFKDPFYLFNKTQAYIENVTAIP